MNTTDHSRRTLCFVIAALGALAGLGCGGAPESTSEVKETWNPNFRVIGHRGAPMIEPENTIPSFEAAAAQGANALELDLCITLDNEIIVWHDRDPDEAIALARQAGSEGLAYVPYVPPVGSSMRMPVDELTLKEFRKNYGYSTLFGDRVAGAYIPTLEETLDWAKRQKGMRTFYLDVKLAEGQGARAAFLVNEVWKNAPFARSADGPTIIFISPLQDIVDAMEAQRRELGAETFRVAWDFELEGALEGTRSLGLRDVSTGYSPKRTWLGFTDEVEEIMAARRRGELDSVTVWTFDDPDEMSEFLEQGVDGIMTNEPGVLRELWQQTLKE